MHPFEQTTVGDELRRPPTVMVEDIQDKDNKMKQVQFQIETENEIQQKRKQKKQAK